MEKDIALIRESVVAIHQLVAELVALQATDRQCCRAVTWPGSLPQPQCKSAAAENPDPADRFVVTTATIESGYWMSRKEAWDRLGVVKSTLEEMIRSGELPSYHRQGDERRKKPRVWLKRDEVERLYTTYTLRKGKEKKG